MLHCRVAYTHSVAGLRLVDRYSARLPNMERYFKFLAYTRISYPVKGNCRGIVIKILTL